MVATGGRASTPEPGGRGKSGHYRWDACLMPAKHSPYVTDEMLDAVGDVPARETRTFFISQNEVAGLVSDLGLDDPPWSKR